MEKDEDGEYLATPFSTISASQALFRAHSTRSPAGAYFIDRDGTHFRHVLNFLRGTFDVSAVPESGLGELRAEAEFYRLPELVTALSTMTFTQNAEFKGLFFHLGTDGGRRPFANPTLDGSVTVVASNPANVTGTVAALVGRGEGQSGYCNSANGFSMTVTLRQRFEASGYSLKWASASGCHVPANWVLEGSCPLT
jgi:hypothetical protein